MHAEKRQDQLQENSGEDRVQGRNPDLCENNPAEGVAEADRAFGQSRGKRPHIADWLAFVQRDKGTDYHPEQEVHKQMHRLFAGVLQFLGMFVEPNRGQRFQVIDAPGRLSTIQRGNFARASVMIRSICSKSVCKLPVSLLKKATVPMIRRIRMPMVTVANATRAINRAVLPAKRF